MVLLGGSKARRWERHAAVGRRLLQRGASSHSGIQFSAMPACVVQGPPEGI